MLTRRSVVWIISLVVAGIAVLAVILLGPRLLYPPVPRATLDAVADPRDRVVLQQAQSNLQNDARSVLLQGFAGLLVVLGAAAAWRQVQVARDGHIADRFSHAVDQLGSDSVSVRVGGIYALERVAKSSPVDRPTVQYILGAFVRGQAAWPPAAQQHPTADVDLTVPWLYVRAPAIQAALNVLGRRPHAPEAWQLYLSRTDLRSASLDDATFSGVLMRYANLARARLVRAHLDGGDLKGSDLRQANAVGVNLAGAVLENALLAGADLRDADLSGADLRGADMRTVNLDRATLTGCRADADTKWPAGWDDAALRARGVRV